MCIFRMIIPIEVQVTHAFLKFVTVVHSLIYNSNILHHYQDCFSYGKRRVKMC